jgi:hypothetical protein
MSRRSTPERLDEARRAATRNRLILDGATEATADAWIAAWEAQAALDGLERGAAYWGGRLGVDRRPARPAHTTGVDSSHVQSSGLVAFLPLGIAVAASLA